MDIRPLTDYRPLDMPVDKFCALKFFQQPFRRYGVTKLMDVLSNSIKRRNYDNIKMFPWSEEGIERFLSLEQMAICECRFNGMNYSELQDLFEISSPTTLTAVFRLTAGSIRWEHGQPGGKKSIITDLIMSHLSTTIAQRRHGMNCLKTLEAKEMINQEVEQAKQKGVWRLKLLNCDGLVDHFLDMYQNFSVSSSLLNSVCQRCNIHIMAGEKLELLRRKFCNKTSVQNYFSLLSTVLTESDPHYLYNADETGLTGKRTFKVLTDDKTMHISTLQTEGTHISCMCSYNACGHKLPLFFIFANRASPLEELQDIDDFYYSSSQTGWMTSNLWDAWCIMFVSSICNKREANQLDSSRPVFLFVDGHPSRMSPFGMRLLKKFNIICIVFPAHCTHVLQPFDILIASPLKTEYLRQLLLPNVITEGKLYTSNVSQEVRRRRVIAFRNAWNKIDETSLRRSFKGAGICPLNDSGLMQSHLISEQTNDTLQVRNCPISGTVATEHLDCLQPLYWRKLEGNRFVMKGLEPSEITPEVISVHWFLSDTKAGRMFSPIPSIPVNGVNLMHKFKR